MKKKLIASLLAALVLSAGSVFAAESPFADVPASHWSYSAVKSLVQAGIVDGYDDGTFKGNKATTRYEMAQIVARVMYHSDKANAEQKATINKLAAEYKDELQNLGVRMGNLEKKMDRITIGGQFDIRYQNQKLKNENGNEMTLNENNGRYREGLTSNFELYPHIKINDNWNVDVVVAACRSMKDGTVIDKIDDGMRYNVNGKVGEVGVTLGVFKYWPVYALVTGDTRVYGAKFDFGKDLKTSFVIGKLSSWGGDKKSQYHAVNFDYDTKNNLNLHGAAYYLKNNAGERPFDGKDSKNIWEVGADTKLSDNITFKANYAKANMSDKNAAYLLGLNYKGATADPGTFGFWVNYMKMEANSYIYPDQNIQPFQGGAKGWDVGFAYTFDKNATWKVKYFHETGLNDVASGIYGPHYKLRTLRTEVIYTF